MQIRKQEENIRKWNSMQTNDLKKASVYYLIGNLFNKGFAFLTVPIFTRILSTNDYGIVTTYNSWVSILSMIMGFAIYMGIRAAFIDYREKIDDFMAVSTTFTLLSSAILCLIIGVTALFIKSNISLLLVILCLLQGVAFALIQNYSMYLMMRYEYKFRTILMIVPNLISAIVSVAAILFVVKTDMFLGRIVPTSLINLAFGLFTVCLVYRKSRVYFNKEYLQFALRISMPLILHGIALNLLSQSDLTMITWLKGSSQAGIYSLIHNFGMIATVITTALDGVWIPWFTERMKTRDIESINKVAKHYINLITCAMIAVILLGVEVVKILASKPYWEGINIIPPIVISAYVIFAYTLYVNIEHYYKKTPYITINTIVAAATNLVLNYVFIPKLGFVAAAYTSLTSYLIAFVLHARYAKKLEKNLYPLKTFIAPFGQLLITCVIFYCFVEKWYLRWSIIGVYLLIMAYKERSFIKDKFSV